MTEASANLSLVLTFANMLIALVLRKVCTDVFSWLRKPLQPRALGRCEHFTSFWKPHTCTVAFPSYSAHF